MSEITKKYKKPFIQYTTHIIGLLLMGFFIPGNCFAQDGIKINENRISTNVAVYNIEGGQSTNIIVIDTDKGLVVIDSDTSPLFAKAVREKIEKSNPGKQVWKKT